MAAAGASSRVLIYGGKGALGASCVTYFKAKNWWVASIDLFPNEEAHANVIVDSSKSWVEQDQEVQKRVEEVLDGNNLDAIVCVAGGWAGGNAKSKGKQCVLWSQDGDASQGKAEGHVSIMGPQNTLLSQAVVKNADLMFKQSVWTSLISASIAAKHLKNGGLLSLTGAQPSLGGTAGMMGYGMAKAAVHQLVKGLGMEGSGLPPDSTALAILPMTLDTPMNRKNMANADFNQWTPLEYVAELLFEWSEGKNKPATGSLVKLNTKDGKSSWEVYKGCLI